MTKLLIICIHRTELLTFLNADVKAFVALLGAVVGYYRSFWRQLWKAQQWLEYVSSASISSVRLSSGGRVFSAKAEVAFRNLTCFNPLDGRDLRAVEETSLNHIRTERRHTWSEDEKGLTKNTISKIWYKPLGQFTSITSLISCNFISAGGIQIQAFPREGPSFGVLLTVGRNAVPGKIY